MEKNLEKIEKIARDVYKKLGSSHPEVVYDRAMQVGLRSEKIKYDSQKVVELQYKGHYVGEGYPDLIVYFGKNKVVVELKAVGGTMSGAEEHQIKNYMKIMNITYGLLINFQNPNKKTGKTYIEIKEVILK